MSTDPSPRAEQIQANVAAALSRLRGEPAGTPQPLPQLCARIDLFSPDCIRNPNALNPISAWLLRS